MRTHANPDVQGEDKAWTVTLAPTSLTNRGALIDLVASARNHHRRYHQGGQDEMRVERITVEASRSDALMNHEAPQLLVRSGVGVGGHSTCMDLSDSERAARWRWRSSYNTLLSWIFG
jgi:hypothetical protein